MLTDAFWWFATSDLGIGSVGALALVAAVVSLLPASVIAKFWPQGAAFVYLARPVMGVALLAMGIGIGGRLADERSALANLKQNLEFAHSELAAQKAATDEKTRLAEENKNRADELQQKVTDYESKLASVPTSAVCALDDNDISGLRGIGRPIKAHRSNPLRLRGLGRPG